MDAPQSLDIRRYVQLLYKKRHLFILTSLFVFTLFIIGAHLVPKQYEASSIVFVERNVINQIIKDMATPSLEERTKALAVVMKSRTMLLKVMNDLRIDTRAMHETVVDEMIAGFQKNTDIKTELSKNRRDMDLFIVSYVDEDPQFARDYVNALVQRYIAENASLKRGEAHTANRFIADQISLYKAKMDRVDAELTQLTSKKGFVRESRVAEIQKSLETLMGQYTESHPEVIKARAELESLQEQSGQGRPVLADQRRVTDLERERDTYKKIYEELVANLGKSEVSSHVEAQDKAGIFRILEPARLPTQPVSPSRMKIMVLGFLAAIGCGAGLIIFLDSMDKSIKKVDTLRTLGVPVLAVIPHIENKDESAGTRRKDFLVYGITGAYVVCLAVIFGMKVLH